MGVLDVLHSSSRNSSGLLHSCRDWLISPADEAAPVVIDLRFSSSSTTSFLRPFKLRSQCVCADDCDTVYRLHRHHRQTCQDCKAVSA